MNGRVFVLGAGAVGLPLAAFLAHAGREVILVRATENFAGSKEIQIRVSSEEAALTVPVETVSLAHLATLDGLVAVAVKSYANASVAAALARKEVSGPLIILQNGLGVERAFLKKGFPTLGRGVLYLTSQVESQSDAGTHVTFRQIRPSPIGTVTAAAAATTGAASGTVVAAEPSHFDLTATIDLLSTPQLRFQAEPDIEREAWKKTIINAVFNSICPLLDADNGVFHRNPEVAGLASEVVGECITLARAHGIALTEEEVMTQAMAISRNSQGVLISTLQDIRHGRPTEIDSLNLELSRLAAQTQPPTALARTEILGRMILAKSRPLAAVSARRFGWPMFDAGVSLP